VPPAPRAFGRRVSRTPALTPFESAPALELGRASMLCALVTSLLGVGCSPAEDPPGRTLAASREPAKLRPPSDQRPSDPEGPGKDALEPGHGAKIASIAMRTWVYVQPTDRSTKLGYLRAGAIVDRAEVSAGTTGCAGGWYRIAPRGYVCVGKGASLALDHPVALAAFRGPDRRSLPYQYVISRFPPPHLYFRLPTKEDQERVEGGTLAVHLAGWSADAARALALDPVPEFLAEGRELPKPYGSEEKLHYSVHTGRAKEQSAFGLITTFDWTSRRFGLTTELDLIPLDRTKPAKISPFHGIEVHGQGTPAFVMQHVVTKLRPDSLGVMHDDGVAGFRSGWVLTGRNSGGSENGLLETTEGVWLPADALVTGPFREDPAGFAREGKKWIDVSIRRQMLIAYEGKTPVYATLVSSGVGAMGDPETTHATVRGTFMIHAKHVSGTMDGDEASDAFDLRDVPFIQYFHEGYALHGAYWHDDFGKPRSHGCVNLAPIDAAWLFEWTDPVVPAEWHGAMNTEAGTLVWTHG
jgi:hypothetical protein